MVLLGEPGLLLVQGDGERLPQCDMLLKELSLGCNRDVIRETWVTAPWTLTCPDDTEEASVALAGRNLVVGRG